MRTLNEEVIEYESVRLLRDELGYHEILWAPDIAPEGARTPRGSAARSAVYSIFPEKKEEANPLIHVENNKSVVMGSKITAGGNVYIGDSIINNEGTTIKNQFNGGTFNNTTFE
jgi:hypothetical protein